MDCDRDRCIPRTLTKPEYKVKKKLIGFHYPAKLPRVTAMKRRPEPVGPAARVLAAHLRAALGAELGVGGERRAAVGAELVPGRRGGRCGGGSRDGGLRRCR